MARKLRLQYEGAIYHITVRGNGRRKIFLDDRDRERILWRLAESKELYGVRIYLYCQMDNHFHLLAETPRANVSRFMQSLLTGYTVYFNLRHNHAGHVVQGRYGAQLVEGNEYLLRLSRYIHLNPVRTREARGWSLRRKRQWLRAYKWSSYRGYIDAARRVEFVEHAPILAMTNGPRSQWPVLYREYVEAGLAETDTELVELLKESPRSIGSHEFRQWVDDEYGRLKESLGSEEDVSFRRHGVIKDARSIVSIMSRMFGVSDDDMRRQMRGVAARPAAAHMLCKHAGLTQREAGRRLGYGTGSAVSHQLKRLREELASRGKVARLVERAEKEIRKLKSTSRSA